jgi:hypothetical protein
VARVLRRALRLGREQQRGHDDEEDERVEHSEKGI